jgi:methyl-accepting chemotaxis protein
MSQDLILDNKHSLTEIAFLAFTRGEGLMFKTIRQKVILGCIAILVLSAGSAGAGLWVATDLTGALKRSSDSAALLRHHMQADQMHDALRGDVLSALMSRNPEAGIALGDVRKDAGSHEQIFRDEIKASLALARDPATHDALQKLDAPLNAYIASAEELIQLVGADPMAADKAYGAFGDKFKTLEVAMEQASDTIQQGATADAKRAEGQGATGRTLMTSAIVASVLFGLGVLLISFRSVLSPINQLTNDMLQLASGNIDLKLKGADRPDEVGAIARAVRTFQEVIVAKGRAEAEDAEKRRAAAAEAEQRDQAERLERAKAQALVVGSLAEGLEHLSAGDVTYRLTTPFDRDYEKLRGDFNGAMDKLQQTLVVIAGNATAMRSATQEISHSADDFSRRTEQQAASLEETAAALDEITTTVRQTAEGAGEARDVVSTTETDAAHSGQVVKDAIAAMSEIESSAREINQIISVIDEIAFQTNLLALNAGVEAARAGDAGRGFAVVASEVRALAQRSADAAKEIKALISTSADQVARGVKLVGESGNALDRIVGKVSNINVIVTRIAASAQEQAVGLHQVNTAVNQMDQVTQQNAAMAEQSTAASHGLAREAETLTASLSKFRLGDEAKPASGKAAQPVQRLQTISRGPGGSAALRKPAAETESWEEF